MLQSKVTLAALSESNKSLCKKLRICIVTPDILGAVRNGGIGTANAQLAKEFAGAGHAVTILFTQHGAADTDNTRWPIQYADQGIEVVIADEWASCSRRKVFPAQPSLAMAMVVHDWLGTREFDVVIFMEWLGHGFYTLHAKRAGLRFQNTALIVQTHSPSLWHATYNMDVATDPLQSLVYFAERKSIELADAVVSPSSYMLDWLVKHGIQLPRLSFVQPNLLDVETKFAGKRRTKIEIDELVFFGRLEYRKGLVQFCDALDRLARLGARPERVTFLGKYARVGQEHAALYIARRAKSWTFDVRILASLDQGQALAYLMEKGRMAVMPSVMDNSPYTVYECLVAGIPFLARNVGGVPELIHSEDLSYCLFDDNPNNLAEAMARVLQSGGRRPRLGFDLRENQQAWSRGILGLHRRITKRRSGEISTRRLPLVSVCLTHFSRPKLLLQAIESLLAQDYSNFEVILSDDGSEDSESISTLDSLESIFAAREWKILRLKNGYLGKARNAAAQIAMGDYLLFMDDDNVARPSMISKLVHAAVSAGADLVTTVFDVFTGEAPPSLTTIPVERYLPVGDVVSFSIVSNAIGDANSLIRRSLFADVGGFSVDYGVGHEDFELFLRAILSGAKTSVVPEPLFWYRRNSLSMLTATNRDANRQRSFRPFIELLPAPLAELAVLAHGLAKQVELPTARLLIHATDVSREEEQVLLNYDPDSSETLATLAAVLIRNEYGGVANAIVADLRRRICNLTNQDEKHSALIRLLIAAHDANVAEVIRILDLQLGAGGNNDQLLNFYMLAMGVLAGQHGAHSSVDLLARKLINVAPDSLLARGYALRHLVPYVSFQRVVNEVVVLLNLADDEYCRRRQDVGLAVRQRQFSCGLHHYLLHGRSEGTEWPQEKMFTLVFQLIEAAIEERRWTVMSQPINHHFALAAKAFSTSIPKLIRQTIDSSTCVEESDN